MAIYGVGYRPLRYQPTPVRSRLWPVARGEYRMLFRHWVGIIAFVLCLLPAVANLGILMVRSGVWQLGVAPDRLQGNPRLDPEAIDFYLVPVIGEIQSYAIFVMLTALVASRAIAKDRETNALEIYWTRGITPRGYFAAKWLGSFLLVATVFVLAPLITWVVGVLLAPDWGMLQRTLSFVPQLALALCLFTAVLSYIAVGFSALAPTANAASVLWLCLMLGASAFGRVVAKAFQGEWWCKALSPWDAAKRLAEWMCGQVPRQDYAPWVAALCLGLVVVAITVAVVRRMRLQETVG